MNRFPQQFADPFARRYLPAGMTVARSTAHRSEREGRTVFFCSAGCKAKFECA